LLLSVVALTVPLEVPPAAEKTTAEPPEFRGLLLESYVVNVSVTLLPEVTVDEETVRSEFAIDGVPGFTVIVGKIVVTD
jgi:hypothetical protein